MTTRQKKTEKEFIPLSVLFERFSEKFSAAPAADQDDSDMPISFRRRSKSSSTKSEKNCGIKGGEHGEHSLEQLAKTHFITAARPSFSRKEVRRPLMQQTPEVEKEVICIAASGCRRMFQTVIKLSKMILRFMGDLTDYRSKMSHASHQPNYGAVMTRLYKQLDLAKVTKLKEPDSESKSTRRNNVPSRYLNKSTKGEGTIKRLRATISNRLFSETGSVFDTLPIEETLMSPLDQLHFIIGIGILKTDIRDELYCLVMKQIVDNPYKESLSRGWLLLWLMAGCFSPSPTIYPFVVKFVEDGPAYFANHLKKLLDRTKLNGTRFQPPSYIELEAALQKKPIEISVTLMDGTLHTVAVDAATTSKEFCEKLGRLIVLQSTKGFALYMCLNDKVASLGNDNDHLLDSVSQCEQLNREVEGEGKEMYAPWRLFFRKEMFIPWEDSQDDYVGTNLTFAQVVRGVTLGEYVCDTDTELALIAAQQYYIEYGGDISEEALQAVLPSYLPENKRKDNSSGDPLKQWRKTVIKIYNKLFGGKEDHLRPDTQRIKLDVVRFAKGKWSTSLSRFYEATKVAGPHWDSNTVTLGLNGEGIDVYGTLDGKKFMQITFPEIFQVSGEREFDGAPAHVVLFFLANGSLLKLESVDAEEIVKGVSFILDGLRQRSRWAVVKQDFKGRSAEELTVKEGDLIVLQQRAREGAMANELCQGTNKRTSHQGELKSNLLFIVPILTEPTEKTLTLFRNKAKKISVPSDTLLGSIVSLNGPEPERMEFNWKSNAMGGTDDMMKPRREGKETHVLVDGENPVKPVPNGTYSGSVIDSEDTSSQRAGSSVLTLESETRPAVVRTNSTNSSQLASIHTNSTSGVFEGSPLSTPTGLQNSSLRESEEQIPTSLTNGDVIPNGHPPADKKSMADLLASRDVITCL